MRAELDEALCRDFPLTFRDRRKDMKVTAMCWGFQCGDGWEPLVRAAAEKIEAILRLLPEKKRKGLTSSTVKEKLGLMRWNFTTSHPAIDLITDDVEARSRETCEDCGAPGTLEEIQGWLSTLCAPCRKHANRR